MLLFHGMQNSVFMVYYRVMGSIRGLVYAPLPCWGLLAGRLRASAVTVLPIVYVFLFLARFWDVRPPMPGYVAALPALLLAGLMLGAFGLALSSLIRQLENFAGVMNFVIFPVFFASTALYPLWRLDEVTPVLARIAELNPFSHAVELIRFALYLQFNPLALGACLVALVLFFGLAVWGYDPGRGFWARRTAEREA